MPVCATCDDTHRMSYGDVEVWCTRCPIPCQTCRQKDGAYCQRAPCPCTCHIERHRNAMFVPEIRKLRANRLSLLARQVYPRRPRAVVRSASRSSAEIFCPDTNRTFISVKVESIDHDALSAIEAALQALNDARY